MKKIDHATQEQWDEIERLRLRWLNDEQVAQYPIERIRRCAWKMLDATGHPRVPVFVVDSPLAAIMISRMFSAHLTDKLDDTLYAQLRDKLHDSLQANLIANLIDHLDDKLRAHLSAQLRDKLRDNLHHSLHHSLQANLTDKLNADLFAKLHDKLRENLDANLSANLDDTLSVKLDANLRASLSAHLTDSLHANLCDNLSDKLHDKLRASLSAHLTDSLHANLCDNLSDKLRDTLRDELRDSLSAHLRDSLSTDLHANLIANLFANLSDNLFAKLYDNLFANLDDTLRENLSDHLIDNLHNEAGRRLAFYCGAWWNTRAAWFEAGSILGVPKIEELDLFLEWNRVCPVWMWSESMLFILKRPTSIHWHSDEGVLHNEHGPAVYYSPLFSLWSIDGVDVDEQIVMKPETQTVGQIDGEENEEVRRIRVERFGVMRYLEESGATVLDSRRNNVEATYEILANTKHGQRLVTHCPSTGRRYFLSIPDRVETCEQAQQALWGVKCNIIGRT